MEAVRQELFPLCVMLYPTLNVSWELVWEMFQLLDEKICDQLSLKQHQLYFPYFKAMQEMFSSEVLPMNLKTA